MNKFQCNSNTSANKFQIKAIEKIRRLYYNKSN